MIICISTSAGIELIQLMIPGRVSDLVDVFANSLGVACGLLVLGDLLKRDQLIVHE